MAFLQKDDLLAVDNTLFDTKKEELAGRKFLHLNTRYPRYAGDISYDWYDMTGSAAILAAGASAKDVPFVGEVGGRETLSVYDIVTGIRFTKSEIQASQARAALGKGPAVSLDTIRVSAARRFISETEDKIIFVGDPKYGIKGLLNHGGIQSVQVSEGSKGTNTAGKKLWVNKTPQEILEDLRAGKAAVEKGNIFKSRVLALDSDHYNMLLKPYSDMSPMTILQWLTSQGAFFEKIVITSQMSKSYNGLDGEVDCFMILDNDPEIVELALIQEMERGEPVYDVLGTAEMAVTERTAGCIIRHPAAIYIGKGC